PDEDDRALQIQTPKHLSQQPIVSNKPSLAFADDEQATIRIVVFMVGREGFDQRRVALVRRDAPYHQDIGLAVSIRIQDPSVGLNRINTINAMKRWNDVAS